MENVSGKNDLKNRGNRMNKISIAVPVFNEHNFIEKTLLSVDGQADEILISDNASTDGTSDICADFARTRPYVRYERYKKNEGASKNFFRSLDRATGEYFMWVGGHDLLEPDHVNNLQEALENSDAVMAYANAKHFDTSYSEVSVYHYPFADILMSDLPEKRLAAIALLTDCSLFHGLYYREVIYEAVHKKHSKKYPLSDHVLLGHIALKGKMILQQKSYYIRLDPRGFKNNEERWKHIMQAGYPHLSQNPYLYPAGIYYGTLEIFNYLERTQSIVNQILVNEVKKFLEKRWKNEFMEKDKNYKK